MKSIVLVLFDRFFFPIVAFFPDFLWLVYVQTVVWSAEEMLSSSFAMIHLFSSVFVSIELYRLSARNVISSCSSECDPSYVPSIQISEETPLDLDEPTTSFEPSFSCVSKIFSSPVPRRCYTHFRSESNTSASDGVFPQLSPSVAFPSAVARAPLFLNHSIEDVSLRMDTDAFSCETPCSYSSCSSSTSFELPSFSPDEYDVNELSFIEHHCPLSPSCELYQLARAASPGTFDILDSCDCASRALYDDSNLSLETASLLPDEDDCERMYPMDASPLASAALKRASLFLEEDIFSFRSFCVSILGHYVSISSVR